MMIPKDDFLERQETDRETWTMAEHIGHSVSYCVDRVGRELMHHPAYKERSQAREELRKWLEDNLSAVKYQEFNRLYIDLEDAFSKFEVIESDTLFQRGVLEGFETALRIGKVSEY